MHLKEFIKHLINALCLELILLIGLTGSYSYIWGRVHPRAEQIYALNLRVIRESSQSQQEDTFLEIQYPNEGASSQYFITMIMVFNNEDSNTLENQENEEISAFITTGGIGLNYTRVRLLATADENNFNIVMYGVNPQLNEYI